MAGSLPFERIDDFELRTIIQDSPNSLAVRAYQISLERPVFLKLLKPHVQDHQRWKARFTREARVCARLKHPHIVDVYTIGEKEGYTYMALEFVEGLSLRELLEREKTLPEPLALEVVRQILLALELAHREGVIHRDIKPGNILLDVHGQVRLTDFGLAHLGEDDSLTQQGSILGTPAYMSPEQITGEPLSPASDFFSLGATLYEMLTGVKPFAGENYSACIQKILNEDPPPPSQWNPALSPDLDRLILRLVSKHPTERPQRAEEILNELEKQIPSAREKERQVELSRLVKRYYVPEETAGAKARPESEKSVPRDSAGARVAGKKWPRWIVARASLILGAGLVILLLQKGIFNASGFRSSGVAPSRVTESRPAENSADSLPGHVVQPGGTVRQGNGAAQSGREMKGEKPLPEPGDVRPKAAAPAEKSGVTERPPLVARASTPARLTLEIEPWAMVSIDGVVRDSMLQRGEFTLSSGKHRLVLLHPEFAPRVLELELRAAEERNLHYSFYQDAAYLLVDVRPWAEVYLDGKFIDNTPLTRPIVLSPGEHLLELKNPYFETVRKSIFLNAGDTLKIQQILQK